MADPVTDVIVKAGVKKAQTLAQSLYETANGARSSEKAKASIAELLAEEAGKL